MHRTVTDTTTDDMKKMMLLEAMLGGADGQIERQEAEGQVSFLASDTLPVNFNGRFPGVGSPYMDYKKLDEANKSTAELTLAKMGIILGDVVDGDPMWRFAKLPPGWKRQGTDHDMWSKIVDDQGRERISVFYKAAFYDRSCHYSLNWFFRVDAYHRCNGIDDRSEVAVLGGGRLMKSFGVNPTRDYENTEQRRVEALQWLESTFPLHDDVLAYWGDDLDSLQQR